MAIIDTGVRWSHTDLNDHYAGGYDYYDEDSNPWDESNNGHGTHVSGIAAAETNNANGIAGVAYNCRFLAYRCGDYYFATNDLVQAINDAVDQGALVLNMSWGSTDPDPAIESALDDAYYAGCVNVAAAGNDGSETELYPAAYPNVIGVASHDSNNSRSSFSNYGWWVSVSAPGRDIYSTYNGNDNGYVYMNGTSMASPQVAGMAVILYAMLGGARSEANSDIVRCAIQASSVPVSWVEYGRVDLDAAMYLFLPNAPPTIDNLPDVTLYKNSGWNNDIVHLPDYASDPDPCSRLSHRITFESDRNVVDCSIDGDWDLDADVQPGMTGFSDVTIEVSDGWSTSRDTMRVFVVSRGPPDLVPVGDLIVDEERTLSVELQASDPDGDPLTFFTDALEVLPSPGEFTQTGPTTAQFEWTPTFQDSGVYQVAFWVEDDEGNLDSETSIITVNNTVTKIPGFETARRVTEDPADSMYPAVAIAPTGQVVVVWTDNRSGDAELYYKVLRSDGAPLTSDVRLTNAAGLSWAPSVAMDRPGVHIVWVDDRDGNDELYYTKITPHGDPLVDDTRLTFDGAASFAPKLVIDSKRSLHVVWVDTRTGAPELFYRKLDNNGNPMGPEIQLTDQWTDYTLQPAVAVDADDNLHIVWTGDGRWTDDSDIYYTKLDDWGQILIQHLRLSYPFGESAFPTVAVDAGGHVHVVWVDMRSGNAELRYMQLDAEGRTVVQDSLVAGTEHRAIAWFPSIAVDGLGQVHLAWLDGRNANHEINYVRLNNAGTVVRERLRLTSDVADSSLPVVALDWAGIPWLGRVRPPARQGRVCVIWEESRDGNRELYFIAGSFPKRR
ncbi:MAG: S8 family serine peptidase [Planctomycetota bacterium]